MSDVLTPPWLAAAAAPPRTASSGQGCSGGKGAARAVPPAQPRKRTRFDTGFTEPEPWCFDGCKRREKVLDHDHNPPRVVRSVGWLRCLCCTRAFWSQDVISVSGGHAPLILHLRGVAMG
jgi:hypothetical protein